MDEEAPHLKNILAINEALLLGTLRHHELLEEADKVNVRLVEMNGALLNGELGQQEAADELAAANEQLRASILSREETSRELAATAVVLATSAKELAEKARLLDLTPDAIIVRDMESRIRFWNHGAEALYGWSSEEAVGQVAHVLLKTQYPTQLTWLVEELNRTGRWTGELVHTTRDGRRITVLSRKTLDRDSEGKPVSELENITDITARKESEEWLSASEARFRAAVSLVSSLVWTNNSEGKMEGPQPGWGNFTGQKEEEYQGYGWAGAVHPEDAQPTVAAWEQAVAEKRVFEFKHRIRRYDGEWRVCSIRAVPLFDEDGGIQEWLGVHTDITDRNRAEEALREAKNAAEAANRAKDHFLAVLSHELRTPLTPVLLVVSAMEHDSELRADVREDFAMIKRNIELETKLIDDLLDISRIASGKLELKSEPVDLNEAVRHVCSICRPQIQEQKVRIETDFCENVGHIAADSARLRQVIWNVLRNAVKFTPAEGTVRVSTARLDAGRCEVRVRDSGIGILPEVLPRIFEAFEQGDTRITRQFGGLGLGLAISRALVALHGGTIRAESAGQGKGATFIIELPGQPAPPAGASLASAAAPAHNGGPEKIRVLVLEDHPDTAEVLERSLRRAGFDVKAVGTIATALAATRAASASEPFDVLVSDIGLPDGSGYDFIQRVRAICPAPAIAMSGYGMEEDLRRSRDAGFAEHLVKPVEIAQLLAAIRRVAEKRA